MSNNFYHIPVLLTETIEALNLKSGLTIVDGTLGGGGHAKLILEKILPNGRLIGIDQDAEALKAAKENLEDFKENTVFVHDNFRNLNQILDSLGIEKVNGILLDLGVSMHQIMSSLRGFSFAGFEENLNAPLDMRMNRDNPITAENILNEYGEAELEELLRKLGEERFARSIAKMIVLKRPLKSVNALLEAIKAGTPPKYRFGKPTAAWAGNVFRAVRMEVNEELEVVREVLDVALNRLNTGGRLAIITFHSLEDRIVKQTFKNWAEEIKPQPGFGVTQKKAIAKIVTRKPILPTADEVKSNPASSSAKLRVVEKI